MLRLGWIQVLVVILIALAALLLIRLHDAGGATLQDSIASGRRLAEAWCKDCHSLDDGRFVRAPDLAKIASRASTTEASLTLLLRSSHRGRLKLVIEPGQAADLTRFVLSLKRD